MMSNRYAVDFFWSDDDEGFIAVVPDLPGCSAFGETRAEAATEIEDAIKAWMEAARAAGNPVPQPSDRKAFQDCSGRILLRMPKELHHDLQRGAVEQGVSLNSYACFLLGQRHYHTHAIKAFSESLEWQTVGFRQGNQHIQILQLNSTTPNQSSYQANSLQQSHQVVTSPIAAAGMIVDA